MVEKGFGFWQMEKMQSAALVILKSLIDNQWHQYRELLEKTKLSSATLSRHLKSLEHSGIVEKNLDTQSGAYPYPVSYRLNPQYQIFDELLNLDSRSKIKTTEERIGAASKALSKAISRIYAIYAENKNREALDQSRAFAQWLFLDYLNKTEPQ
jgi:DNA-binding HxlR family transcriptional regulator